VHPIASLLKRWLLGTHQSYLNKNKLEYYLDEYVFRYNRSTSTSRGLLFLKLVEQAVNIAPVSYKEIIRQNHTGHDCIPHLDEKPLLERRIDVLLPERYGLKIHCWVKSNSGTELG